jgi:hypothetical protein
MVTIEGEGDKMGYYVYWQKRNTPKGYEHTSYFKTDSKEHARNLFHAYIRYKGYKSAKINKIAIRKTSQTKRKPRQSGNYYSRIINQI